VPPKTPVSDASALASIFEPSPLDSASARAAYSRLTIALPQALSVDEMLHLPFSPSALPRPTPPTPMHEVLFSPCAEDWEALFALASPRSQADVPAGPTIAEGPMAIGEGAMMMGDTGDLGFDSVDLDRLCAEDATYTPRHSHAGVTHITAV
jgi:hypothetical protein